MADDLVFGGHCSISELRTMRLTDIRYWHERGRDYFERKREAEAASQAKS